jgi:hypothetical protein
MQQVYEGTTYESVEQDNQLGCDGCAFERVWCGALSQGCRNLIESCN